MIPTVCIDGSSAVPSSAAFWMPPAEELRGGEGFGFFRDTWVIRDVPVGEARFIVKEERSIVQTLDGLARSREHFEVLASALEMGIEDGPGSGLTKAEIDILGRFASELPAELGGLELGVAGLAHALATVRILPAASCRSHANAHSWSPAPVVLFAATEFRACALQPLVEQSECVFGIDSARPELLMVEGPSILHTMALAEAVLSHRQDFVQPRGARKQRAVSSEQVALF